MKSDGQINIDKYRVAAHKILQKIIKEQIFFFYVIKKMKNRIPDMEILAFL